MGRFIEGMRERPRFVTVYAITRHYGGPEEGGWWYNHYEPVETRRVWPWQRPERVQLELRRRHEDKEWGDIYSMGGGTQIAAWQERERCEFETTERPHYE